MPDIRVILDPAAQADLVADRIVRVATEADYWQARKDLRVCMEREQAIVVWVTSPALISRFDDLKVLEGVEVVDYDLRHELSQLLNFDDLPALFTDTLIGDLGLTGLARTSPPDSGELALTWVLRRLSAEFWGHSRPSDADVCAVLQLLAATPPMPAALQPIVAARIQEWARLDSSRALWQWLREDSIRKARCLAHVYATRGYGPIADQWLQQEGITNDESADAVPQLQFCAPFLRFSEGLLSRPLRQLMSLRVQALFEENGAAAADAVMIGSPEELQCVEQYLARCADEGRALSPGDVAHLERVIGRLPESPQTRRLARATTWLVDQPLPSLLPPAADWFATQHWLESEYFPSCIARSLGPRLLETEEAATSFEDWLLSNYQPMMNMGQTGVHTFCCTPPLDQNKQAMLVVLVDGVPAFLMREFARQLVSRAGLHLTRDGLRLSLLPTRTAQNRRGILSGRLPDQSGAAEPSAVAELVGASPTSVQVVSVVSDVQTIEPGQVVFCHHRLVDEQWLHKPHKPLARWLGVMEVLDDLAGRLASICALAREGNTELLLGCVSDHGWTEIPPGPAVPLSDEQSARVSHGRVLDGLADPMFGRPLDRHTFYLDEDSTIASGYTVLGRRPKGAVHGGATPQEAVVYGFWASTTAQASAQDLGIEISGDIRRAVGDNPVTVRIANSNAFPVVVTGVHLSALMVDPGRLPLAVAGGDFGHLPGNCTCEGFGNMIALRGYIEWTPEDGSTRRQPVSIELPTTGAAQTDEAFESMFDG